MAVQENKTIFRHFLNRLVNAGDIGAVDDLLAPEFHSHEALPADVPPGREGMKQLFQMLRGAFPDLQVSIEDMVAEQDRVVARLTFRGTHQGDFMGMPPTGRAVAYEVIDIVRVHQGQLVEHWGVADTLGLMQQLSEQA